MQIELINNILYEKTDAFKFPVLKLRYDMIMMVEEGSCSVLLEGRKKPYTLSKNEIAYIPANTEMRRSITTPLTYYYLSFYSQADHPFCRSILPGKLTLPSDVTASIFRSIRRAYPLVNNREPISHVIEHIFAENYLFGKTKKVNFKPLSEEVKKAIRYMTLNISDSIDMHELAAQVYLSHSGLIWKFRQELGTTPSQYLIQLRLQYAKQLLLNQNYSIVQISEKCGYSSPYYFTNAFHKYAGMSPTEFRARHLRGKDDIK